MRIITDIMSLFVSLKSNDWKDIKHVISEIKTMLSKFVRIPTLLSVPSHCQIQENDRVEKFTDMGNKLDQKDVPVTSKITRARIKRTKMQGRAFESNRRV